MYARLVVLSYFLTFLLFFFFLFLFSFFFSPSRDDCWSATTRDSNNNLMPDPKLFPSGMKALADYIHARDLKFGLCVGFCSSCSSCSSCSFYMHTFYQQLHLHWNQDMPRVSSNFGKTGCMRWQADEYKSLFGQGPPGLVWILRARRQHACFVGDGFCQNGQLQQVRLHDCL